MMSRLDNPAIVIGKLQEAGRSLSAAHAAASETEGHRDNLTGPVRDAIFGINTTVDALVQMIDEGRLAPSGRVGWRVGEGDAT